MVEEWLKTSSFRNRSFPRSVWSPATSASSAFKPPHWRVAASGSSRGPIQRRRPQRSAASTRRNRCRSSGLGAGGLTRTKMDLEIWAFDVVRFQMIEIEDVQFHHLVTRGGVALVCKSKSKKSEMETQRFFAHGNAQRKSTEAGLRNSRCLETFRNVRFTLDNWWWILNVHWYEFLMNMKRPWLKSNMRKNKSFVR